MKIFENFKFDDLKFREDLQDKKNEFILGIVEGKSFELNGISRNGRFYPAACWENALKDKEFNQKLKDRLLYGCIGHPEDDISEDELLAEGKVSHIVTKVWIKDGSGYARFEILNTPAGRILYTILKAGSKINVSTRSTGKYVNNRAEALKYLPEKLRNQPLKVISPEGFKLETIDFVITPGISSVDVKLIETLVEKNKEDFEKLKESKMICEDGVCYLSNEINLFEKLKQDLEFKEKIIEKLKLENQKYFLILKENEEKISKEIENKENENKEIENKEIENKEIENKEIENKKIENNKVTSNDEFSKLFEILKSNLDAIVKRNSVFVSKEDFTKAILEFLDIENYDLKDFEKLKEIMKNEDFDEKETVFEIIDKIIKLYNNKNEKEFFEGGGTLYKINFKQKYDDLQNEMEKLKDEKEKLKNEKEVLKNKLKNLIDERKDFKETIDILTKKIVELNEKNEILKATQKTILENFKKEKIKLKEKDAEINFLKEKLNNLENEKIKFEEKFENEIKFKENFNEEKLKQKIEEKFEKDFQEKLYLEKIILEKDFQEKFFEKLENEKIKLKEKFEKDLNDEKIKLEENYKKIIKNYKKDLEKFKENFEKMKKEFENLKKNEMNLKIKYYSSKFKNIDENEIKNIVKKYNQNDEKIENLLLELNNQNINEDYNGIKIIEKKENSLIKRLI